MRHIIQSRIHRYLWLLFLLVLSPVNSYASEQWTPEIVDWQVSQEKDRISNSLFCQIEWTYDDFIVSSFEASRTTGRFHVKVLEISASEYPTLSIKGNKLYKAWIDFKGQREVPIAAMGKSSSDLHIEIGTSAITLTEMEHADSIYIEIDNRLLALPLANAMENFKVFSECSEQTGYKSLTPMNPQNIEDTTVSPAIVPPPETATTLTDPLETVDVEPLDATIDTPTNLYEKARMDAQEKLSTPYTPSQIPPPASASARSPNYSALRSEVLENHKATQRQQPIIKNLTKKLNILEKEKEALRKKLLSMSDDGLISNIVACEPEDIDNEVLPPIDSSIIAQFENTIEQQRTQNQELQTQIELLQRQTETEDTGISPQVSISKEEINALKHQIQVLKDRNIEQQKLLYSYETLNSTSTTDQSIEVEDDAIKPIETITDNDTIRALYEDIINTPNTSEQTINEQE